MRAVVSANVSEMNVEKQKKPISRELQNETNLAGSTYRTKLNLAVQISERHLLNNGVNLLTDQLSRRSMKSITMLLYIPFSLPLSLQSDERLRINLRKE